jgi:hypothetical protein
VLEATVIVEAALFERRLEDPEVHQIFARGLIWAVSMVMCRETAPRTLAAQSSPTRPLRTNEIQLAIDRADDSSQPVTVNLEGKLYPEWERDLPARLNQIGLMISSFFDLA